MHALPDASFLMRRGAAVALSALTTATLLLLMFSLIDTDLPVLHKTERIRFDAIMPPREEPRVERPTREEKPDEPEKIPEWESPAPTLEHAIDQGLYTGNFRPEAGHHELDPDGGTSTIVPVFRIAPDYPASALSRGIEGYVDLVFDVAPSGKTENIRVLHAQPEGVFERAALRTLAKWKYKPPVQNGVPYGQQGMTTRISFRLED